ncbi:MAG TPA: DUF3027 domain-containing protein [Streptosporangiaceae bacterium]|nr:DUF3027 domain-containing protein [Streptosporangiaceae bacterium]
MSPTTTRQAEPDQACADAVDLARAAAEADAGTGQVGEHVGSEVESDRVVTHLFASLDPGYVGWRWAVTVARASRSKTVTVSESVLLPGPDALKAPDWVPWTDRVRPGDLKAGDLLPARSDDERLVPAVAIAGDTGLLDWDESGAWRLPGTAGDAGSEAGGQGQPGEDSAAQLAETDQAGQAGESGEAGESPSGEAAADQGAAARGTGAQGEPRTKSQGGRSRSRRRSGSRDRDRTPGLLRPARVLSAVGRDEAAYRWYTGEQGPRSELASTAPANCVTCGFLVRLSGPLGQVFGVCANEFAPDDGKVVAFDHGCGAHSDGAVAAEPAAPDMAAPTVDELGYDMLNTGATVPDSVLETLDHEQL